MAPPDQGSGATLKATAAEMSCTCGHDERPSTPPHRHERKLSSSTSFSSPTSAFSYSSSSSTASTNYLPASSKLSSFSSTSSLESFYHVEALDDAGDAAAAADTTEFIDFEPCTTTRPPAVQTMMPQKSRQRAAEGAAAGEYDPKRLPSSMFRTRPTANPGEWSATSNESLFSIQLSSSAADMNERYSDLYYDAAGFARFPSLGRDGDGDAAALKPLPSSLSERSGGLCVRHDCARCSSGNKTRKSVRFAATESAVVAGGEGGKHAHSVVVSTVETEETEAPAAAAADAPAAGWCEFGCCLGSSSSSSSLLTAWWPRCCGCHGCSCHCKWWF